MSDTTPSTEQIEEAAGRLGEALAAVQFGITDLGQTLMPVMDHATLHDLLETLHMVRAERKRLADLEATLESAAVRAAREVGAREAVLDDGTPVAFMGGTERKEWRHQDVAKAIIEKMLDDAGGEIPSPWDVRDALLAAAAPAYWRAGALRKMGLDPNDYCATTPGRRTVKFD